MIDTSGTIKVDTFNVDNVDNNNSSLYTECSISSKSLPVSENNKLVFNPILNFLATKNPFILTDRNFPVDLVYKCQKQKKIEINIPVGYEVETLPKQANMDIFSGACNYKYQISKEGNKITVITSFKLNQTYFEKEKYSAIKEFYDTIQKLEKQEIIFQKRI
jgi:hypothetical protein